MCTRRCIHCGLYNFVDLGQVVNESLRVYPLTFVERRCVKDYKVPGMDFVIPAGMIVQIARS